MLGFEAINDTALSTTEDSDLGGLLARIDALQEEIEALRPLEPNLLGRIDQRFRIDWNYHGNNIEGNSYDYGETKALLLHGLCAGGKPLRDSLELRGHNTAILSLHELAHSNTLLTENTILSIHKQIFGGDPYTVEVTNGHVAGKTIVPGRYKQEANHIRTSTGEMFYFTEPRAVPLEIRELLEWYRREEAAGELHPVALAAILHYRFVRINPFDTGNDRVAGILMNHMLMKHGYPVVIVKAEERRSSSGNDRSFALRQANGESLDSYVTYIASQEIPSQELWLRGARGASLEDIDTEIALLKARIRRPDLVKSLV